MAKDVKVVLKSAGVVALLNDPKVVADLGRRAQAIATSAQAGTGPGDDYGVSTSTGKRGRATVWTRSYEARVAEAKNRTLTAALEAGRS